ncbi:MAG: hypothetical protein PHH85_09135 [Candidatus Methanoperedens sp.]|nr:hypothetical protein [Candidatus Methanoperedens sp.]
MNRNEMLRRLAAGEPALEVSIAKWQDIVDETGINESADNCALCETTDATCDNCLIYQKTGIKCQNTPYGQYCKKPSKENAQAELDFLKSLRG